MHSLLLILAILLVGVFRSLAQSNSDYVQAAMLIQKKSSHEFIALSDSLNLNPNNVFAFPVGSAYPRPAKYTTNSSPSYHSRSNKGLGGLFGAFAKLLVTPFEILGKIMDGKGVSGSYGSKAADSTASKIVVTHPSTLYAEMYKKRFYGNSGKIYYNCLRKSGPDLDILDSLFSGKKEKPYLWDMYPLSCYVGDTNTLDSLVSRGRINLDSNFNVNEIRLRNPILMASYYNDEPMLTYLMRRGVNPNVITTYYLHKLFAVGVEPHILDVSRYAKSKYAYGELAPHQLCSDRKLKSSLMKYTKHFNRNTKRRVL